MVDRVRRLATDGIGRAALAAAVGLLVLVPGAQAAPFEPNDTFEQAHGPMAGGTDYAGSIETSNDLDYFFFNTKGQRQLDLSVKGSCARVDFLDSRGEEIADIDSQYDYDGTGTAHILYTSPRAAQYVVRVDGSTGCNYTLRVDPADAITAVSPGITVEIGAGEEADDIQRVFVNDALVGTVQGTAGGSFVLGTLDPGARIRFEAENVGGEYSWDVTVTSQTERALTTIFTERADQDGVGSSGPRVGIVRRVVISPSGAPSESCGERYAPVTCIPIDDDKDGVAVPQDCNDANAAVRPGAQEIIDNDTDENCDGVVARRARHGSSVSLNRIGKRLVGRMRSTGAECLGGRKVSLRRAGSGSVTYATATTRSDGRYAITLRRRLKGRLYVVVGPRVTATSACGTARSARIRG